MANSLPILTFHTIENSSSKIAFSPEVFQLSMRMLFEQGYRTISLSRVIEYISRDEQFPERTLVLTFDDGYESTFKEAFPILRKYGMTATVFLVIGDQTNFRNSKHLPPLGRKKMISWDNIYEMQSAGIDFGSHTLTHPDLTRVPIEHLDKEIRESRSLLEDALGKKVSAFAYPYGNNTRTIREIVKNYYSLACCGRLGLVTQSSDPFALERIDMYYFRTVKLSHLLLSRRFPSYIHLRNVPRQIKSILRRGRFL
jgi:peptidoglycan/xylan/chitin deacetylase (PgdA/CDA1 family)